MTNMELKLDGGVHTEVVDMTPAMAGKLLERNTHNRPLQLGRAERLAEAIQRGEWVFNGDAVRISSSGKLLDGQHRLQAILMGGKTCRTVLITGLPDEVMHAIDTNRKTRTACDVLTLAGKKNAAVLAAGARMLYAYQRCGNPAAIDSSVVATVEQITELVNSTPELEEAVYRTNSRPWCKKFLTLSLTSAADYLFTRDNLEASLTFWAGLEKGVGLAENSPILQLREKLVGAYSEKSKISAAYRAALLWKAYRLHRDGQTVGALIVRFDKLTARELFKL